MLTYRLNINPVPASRPRVSKWGTYYGKRHQAFRSEALALLGGMREEGLLPEAPLSGRLLVWVMFSVKKPKTTKLTTPRGDIDNYLKLLLDCCTGFIWEDDQQIVRVCAFKDFAADEGLIDLVVEEIDDDNKADGAMEGSQEDDPGPVDSSPLGDEGLHHCAGGHVFIPHLPACRPC